MKNGLEGYQTHSVAYKCGGQDWALGSGELVISIVYFLKTTTKKKKKRETNMTKC